MKLQLNSVIDQRIVLDALFIIMFILLLLFLCTYSLVYPATHFMSFGLGIMFCLISTELITLIRIHKRRVDNSDLIELLAKATKKEEERTVTGVIEINSLKDIGKHFHQ